MFSIQSLFLLLLGIRVKCSSLEQPDSLQLWCCWESCCHCPQVSQVFPGLLKLRLDVNHNNNKFVTPRRPPFRESRLKGRTPLPKLARLRVLSVAARPKFTPVYGFRPVKKCHSVFLQGTAMHSRICAFFSRGIPRAGCQGSRGLLARYF